MIAALEKASNRWVLAAFGLVVLAAIGPVVVEPVVAKVQLSRMPDPQRDRSSAIVQALRGLQLSLADICYNKSLHYQHSGILYRTEEEEDILADELREQHQRDAAQSADESTSPSTDIKKPDQKGQEHDLAHAGHEHPPLIPTAEEDFRGIIGDVERAVKPTTTTHVRHTRPEEALPWLKLATWINPAHENAWVATAFSLKNDLRATTRAIQLLERAIRLNPMRPDQVFDKYQLCYLLGHIYLHESRNPGRALEVLEPCVERSEKDFPHLDPIQRDWLTFCFRDAAMAARRLARVTKNLDYHRRAIEIGERGFRLFPDDRPLRDSLRRERFLLEKALKAAPR